MLEILSATLDRNDEEAFEALVVHILRVMMLEMMMMMVMMMMMIISLLCHAPPQMQKGGLGTGGPHPWLQLLQAGA
jgi:hypothetical protein